MRNGLLWMVAAGLLAGTGGFAWQLVRDPARSAPRPALPVAASAIPVTGGVSEAKDVPVYLDGLGTVQAFNTVTVKVRVDGQLDKVAFTEGQDIKAGDLLAQIDPRPFQATLDQAKAALARDQANLANAKLDLTRFVGIGSFATRQSVDTQTALVAQLQATVASDQAAIESAQIQLDYTTIRAPLSGRTGIRLVDQGNIVHATDTTGLVVITQLHPISVIFNLPEEQLQEVFKAQAAGPLKAFAMTRTDRQPLGEGTLALVDNLADRTTGSIRLKATFPNTNDALWPDEFVDVRLLLRTLHQAVTIPSTAIQRGPDGTYVYVIKPDSTVAMQPIHVLQAGGGTAVVDRGLQSGVPIVVAGQYRLQPGSRVRVEPAPAGVASAT